MFRTQASLNLRKDASCWCVLVTKLCVLCGELFPARVIKQPTNYRRHPLTYGSSSLPIVHTTPPPPPPPPPMYPCILYTSQG
ncbi:hypothetical protein E2C01_001713 [Portunus trituberculatus]|uniref:Uncharacterized protein n=1 Tax=Portunus trituberculatus TaxID=210409 RepID=A0A5B7CJY8_PORTR|nr:hypothetical protein [Portunus trituberculatus]